VKSKSIV